MSDQLFETPAMHNTPLTIMVHHRFAVGEQLVDVAGGQWKVSDLVYHGRARYRLTPLDDIARASVLGGTGGHFKTDTGHDRLENVATVDRHFNPA